MLSISHAVTGAVIASRVGNPALAVPLILASHYAADAVPHWDAGTGLGKGVKSTRLALRDGLIDLALAGVMVIVYYPSLLRLASPGTFSAQMLPSMAPLWGAFFGLLPDFLEAPRNFLHAEPRFLRPVNRFHHSFHHSIPRPLAGLLPQLFLLLGLWFIR